MRACPSVGWSVGRYTDYGGARSAAPWKGRKLVGKSLKGKKIGKDKRKNKEGVEVSPPEEKSEGSQK